MACASSPSSRATVAEKKTVHAVAKSLYGKPFHFAIVDPTTQRSFAETFDVRNPVDYPTDG